MPTSEVTRSEAACLSFENSLNSALGWRPTEFQEFGEAEEIAVFEDVLGRFPQQEFDPALRSIVTETYAGIIDRQSR